MNTTRILAAMAALAIGTAALAAGKTYQVTGTVDDVSDSTITVTQDKGKNKGEKFELIRTPDTKVTGDLKKGGKATVEYTITAKTVEVKAEKSKK